MQPPLRPSAAAFKNRPLRQRLGYACSGIATVFRREASFRTQCAAAAGAALVLLWLRPSPGWIAAVIAAAGVVLALELVNAALEYLLDHLHPVVAEEIGRAKDAAAGAVLVASLASLAVGGAMVLDTLGAAP
jgi:diacylglycerol kinase (ATP)